MEYINGGSLTDCLKNYQKRNNGKSFPEEIVQYLMRQIVDAIKYIHGKKIIHRDLKLDNIMVSFNNDYDKNTCNMLKSTIKIIDFGFSIQLTPSKNNLASSVLGSPINMDPAILKEMANRGKKVDQLGYDQKADIWSLGTICYELLIGKSVFNAETMNELVSKVENGNYKVPTTVSSELVSFLNGMLQYDGNSRLSADELSKHPFLVKNCNNFTKINTNRVQKKISGGQLNINVKKNQTIWSIFNEEDEKKLININARNYNPAPLQPIPEIPQGTRRTKTDVNIPRINPNNINRNYGRSASNNNYPYYGPVNSIYMDKVCIRIKLQCLNIQIIINIPLQLFLLWLNRLLCNHTQVEWEAIIKQITPRSLLLRILLQVIYMANKIQHQICHQWEGMVQIQVIWPPRPSLFNHQVLMVILL